jgi:Tol biopolymer transport system component
MYRKRLLAAVAAGVAALPAAAWGATSAPAARERTVRISLSNTGAQGDRYAGGPVLSRNGRYVAFYGSSTNLVPGDTNSFDDVFVRDRWAATTTRVSVSSAGAQGNAASGSPAISADGRWVAFLSDASNLVPGDVNGRRDVFVRDLRTGTTSRISVSSRRGQANDHSSGPAISAHGRYVAFWSVASNLIPGDTNGLWDVFVHDRRTNTTTRVSVSDTGAQGAGTLFGSSSPAISADGRYIVFGSAASNLVPRDTNNQQDVFVYSQLTGHTIRVSVSTRGAQAADTTIPEGISADGRHIGFTTAAALVPDDTNEGFDAYVQDRP